MLKDTQQPRQQNKVKVGHGFRAENQSNFTFLNDTETSVVQLLGHLHSASTESHDTKANKGAVEDQYSLLLMAALMDERGP